MSSTIWNSTPSSLAKVRNRTLCHVCARPLSSSTHSTLAAISRPVFSSCRSTQARRARMRRVRPRRCTARRPCPCTPVARGQLGGGGEDRRRLALLLGQQQRGTPPRRARRRPGSPTSSPNASWQVGRPRRRSSSSIAGRSSWISEYVWISSIAAASGSTDAGSRRRSPRRSRARAPGGSACRRRAASSASPRSRPAVAILRREAQPTRGSARPRRGGARGRRRRRADGWLRATEATPSAAAAARAGPGSGSSAARACWSTWALASAASWAHSSISAERGVGLELSGAQPLRGLLKPSAELGQGIGHASVRARAVSRAA